ncbi:hypothetical protein B0H10DRAFT_2361825 [Mycena sp. CBHHK59/15]|nr:hypothetical protein B0H10DRAFT_2361825 [Mycena sp. CBHHK59/15]
MHAVSRTFEVEEGGDGEGDMGKCLKPGGGTAGCSQGQRQAELMVVHAGEAAQLEVVTLLQGMRWVQLVSAPSAVKGRQASMHKCAALLGVCGGCHLLLANGAERERVPLCWMYEDTKTQNGQASTSKSANIALEMKPQTAQESDTVQKEWKWESTATVAGKQHSAMSHRASLVLERGALEPRRPLVQHDGGHELLERDCEGQGLEGEVTVLRRWGKARVMQAMSHLVTIKSTTAWGSDISRTLMRALPCYIRSSN